LARRLDVRSILVKDESRNPTWSFKDRAASVAALRALQNGSAGLVVSSTGNAAAATSAYSASIDLPIVVLFAQGVDEIFSRFVRAFGATIVVTPTKSDRWVFMRRCVEEFGFYPNSNFADPPVGTDPFALDGYKAIAFEIWDQLGGRSPAGIVTPVGYGDSLFAIYKAFSELGELSSAGMPRMVAGEMYGSLSKTLAEGAQSLVKTEIDRATVASSIGTAQSTYQALHAIKSSNGAVYHLTDEEVLEAQRLLIETEGLFVEAASAAGIAALVRDLHADSGGRDRDYVFINTSAGVKSVGAVGDVGVEPKVMGDVEEFARLVSDLVNGAKEG
jgi:threonine synthase